MNIDVQIKILDSRAQIPEIATSGSAAFDLRAMLNSENLILKPQESALIKTGLAIHIGDKNYAALILPRSGLGHKHGIILGNSVGLIDSDYQGELMVSLWNRSEQDFELKQGDRIAQLLFLPLALANFIQVDDFNSNSSRNVQGFGHTGTK